MRHFLGGIQSHGYFFWYFFVLLFYIVHCCIDIEDISLSGLYFNKIILSYLILSYPVYQINVQIRQSMKFKFQLILPNSNHRKMTIKARKFETFSNSKYLQTFNRQYLQTLNRQRSIDHGWNCRVRNILKRMK